MRQFSVPEDQIEERVIVGESADIIKPEETSGNMELDDDVVTDAKSWKDVWYCLFFIVYHIIKTKWIY